MYGNNPYYQQKFQSNIGVPPTQMPQPMQQPQFIPPAQPIQQNTGLQGKIVDSVDVVKAMDIPLDGSISYFPITDGSAIVTKKLQADGTSKTIVYKPIEENSVEAPKYATMEDIEKEINKIDLSDLDDIKDEIKDIKKEIKDIKKRKGE